MIIIAVITIIAVVGIIEIIIVMQNTWWNNSMSISASAFQEFSSKWKLKSQSYCTSCRAIYFSAFDSAPQFLSTTELYPAVKPRPQALLSTPSQLCFHTNRKHSLGKSLLFPLGSSCQSEKLPLHPSLNSCGDFSLGSLGLPLAELQGEKTESGIKKISTSKPLLLTGLWRKN